MKKTPSGLRTPTRPSKLAVVLAATKRICTDVTFMSISRPTLQVHIPAITRFRLTSSTLSPSTSHNRSLVCLGLGGANTACHQPGLDYRTTNLKLGNKTAEAQMRAAGIDGRLLWFQLKCLILYVGEPTELCRNESS